MRKLFVSLYLALIVAFALSLFGIPFLWNQTLRKPLSSYGEQLSRVPQYLIEQELQTLPREQWSAHIESWQSEFGQPLALQALADLSLTDTQKSVLAQGVPIMPLDENRDDMYLPIRMSGLFSGQVLRLSFGGSGQTQNVHAIQGVYFLLQHEWLRHPDASPRQVTADLSARFNIPLRWLPVASLNLDASQRTALQRGDVIGFNMSGYRDEYYWRRIDADVLQVGPLPAPLLIKFSLPVIYGGIALTFGLIAFLWIRPLWRDLRLLATQAVEFGAGNLNVRVKVGRRSAVNMLAESFNTMAARITTLMARQHELSNAISHELRTPLARARFALDMLATANDAERQRYLSGLRKDLQELTELVDESLVYSRLGASAVSVLRLEKVALDTWLSGVIADSQPLPEQSAITPTLSLAAGSCDLFVDARLMRRALNNLLQNAMRHARSRVQVLLEQRADKVALVIDDDGNGIPASQREAVFVPFFRLESSGEETSGYGLGLAIVKRICELHGMAVHVEDSPLGGARFVIEIAPGLPLQR